MRLESLIREVVVELMVAGEAHYRAGAQAHHDWVIECRVELKRWASEVLLATDPLDHSEEGSFTSKVRTRPTHVVLFVLSATSRVASCSRVR